jgi:DNA repair exonuclease SbcCD ATPase subunit
MASLTRRFLEALGVEEKAQDQIMEKHSEVVNEIKTERDKFKEDAEKLPEVQKQLDDLKAKQSEDDPSELEKVKKELADKTAEFEKYKGDIEAKETKTKKETAYRKLLKDAGIGEKYLDIVVKANQDEINNIAFDKEGNVKDSDKITAGMKESLSAFVVTTQQKGADVQNPPAGNGGGEQKPSRAAELFKQHAAEMYGNKNSKED